MEYILTEKESDIIIEYYQKLVGEQLDCFPDYKGYKITLILGIIYDTDKYKVNLVISKEIENAKPDEMCIDLFDYLFAKIEKELNN